MSRRRRAEAEPEEGLSRGLATALESWFRAGHRDMPWRRTRDPYAIWVSEIMLQQTRVETVLRYYDAFLERFPTVAALAAADEQAVLGAWSGLGYYRRARLLHRGARHVVEHHDGRVPDDPQALRRIPGIGAYTTGAIASIAFDRAEPLVDGNVARVLSRIEGVDDPAQQGATAGRHWTRVAEILGHGTPRMLAQALMELGATVCVPSGPRCLLCPVRSSCAAYATGRVDAIPAPRKKVAQPQSWWIALAIVWRGRLLLVRRPADGLLGDLWCLPLVETDAEGNPLGDAPLDGATVPLRWTASAARDAAAPSEVRHVFTHRIWQLRVRTARAGRKPRWRGVDDARHCWITPGERPQGGIPSLTEKLLTAAGY